MINNKDREILLELDINSRQNNQAIGKKLKLSKEVVNYRIKKMLDEKIITNFTAIIDNSKLGIQVYRTFINFQNTSEKKEKEIINYIIKDNNVSWAVSIFGKWNLNFHYWAENKNSFSKFIENINKRFGKYIFEEQTEISDYYTIFPKKMIANKTFKEIPSFTCGKEEKINLDSKDIKILSILANNSREKLLDISKKTNLAPNTVISKIKNLKKEKILLSYSIGIDANKIGFKFFHLVINYKNYDSSRI
ncbi:MAG: AsnC family transcriptional regulator, partial [archaeon]